MIELRVLVEKVHGAAKDLSYVHDGDSGIDLYSTESVELKPLERKLVGTGIKIQMPKSLEAQIRPKSGLAINNGITLLNTPGTIDSSYRGEIKIIVINFGEKAYRIEAGQKIAQMVFAKVEYPSIEVVQKLDDTTRRDGGFGSTGLK